MQRSLFKSASFRSVVLFNQLKSFQHSSLYVRESAAASPEAKSRCLDMLGRLVHGRLNLLGGRPVPPRFLPLLTGDHELLFNSDENEEFRKRLAMQLKELREALQETQEVREYEVEDFQEDNDEEVEPYVPRSREISAEDLTDEELSVMREVRMSASKDGEGSNSEQPETSEKEGGETAEANEPLEPQDQQETVEHVLDGEIEGVYWTGEGRRIVTQRPKRKTVHSGFVDGEGEEILQEESPSQPLPYQPPSPRAQATSKVLKKGRKPGTSSESMPRDSDE
ncbi:uncharacterized protein LOC108109642 [Drosophila eugracilis]|uniref:uncharacterized protein LOC108109642 n=1 Tax=Drosophila eugracilis TaxID=29029 RepID=UPI0007E80D68|nr:uncharacterized protein LOC108109642 [Drosophila eugracilis]